jgi:hypothetical protein
MKGVQAPLEAETDTFLLHPRAIVFVIGFLEKDQYKSRQYTLNMYTPA